MERIVDMNQKYIKEFNKLWDFHRVGMTLNC